MSYHVVGPLLLADDVNADGAVASLDLSEDSVKEFMFSSSGTYDATVKIEATVDPASVTDANATWTEIATVSPTGTQATYSGTLARVRAIVSAYASGALDVSMKAV